MAERVKNLTSIQEEEVSVQWFKDMPLKKKKKKIKGYAIAAE